MKKIILASIAVVTILMIGAGLLIPIDSYTTTQGCPDETTPTKRLRLILGESLQSVKDTDVQPPPEVGCSQNTQYVLYLF